MHVNILLTQNIKAKTMILEAHRDQYNQHLYKILKTSSQAGQTLLQQLLILHALGFPLQIFTWKGTEIAKIVVISSGV